MIPPLGRRPLLFTLAFVIFPSLLPAESAPDPVAGSATTLFTTPGLEPGMAGDVDRDGDQDWIAPTGADQVLWFENDGSESGWSQHTIAGNFDAAALTGADFDHDQTLDVVAISSNGDGLSVFENLGDGTWTEHVVSAVGGSWVGVEDLDRDGDLDVFGGAPLTWYENPGSLAGTWTARAVVGASATVAGIATDVDQDGRPDLVTAGGDGSSSVVFWQSSGTPPTFTKRVVTSSAAGAESVAVGDIDGDGAPDIAAAAETGDAMTWYELVGPTPADWAARSIDSAVDGASSARLVDLDFDGDLDLQGAARDGGSVDWWENEENDVLEGSAWTRRTLASGVTTLGNVTEPDFDRDGDSDALFEDLDTGSLLWVPNPLPHRQLRYRTLLTQITEVSDATSVAPGDLDQDGDLDVALFADQGTDFEWLENDGSPEDGGWILRDIVPAGSTDSEVRTTLDLDRDGDLDLLVRDASDWAWLENDGTPQDGGWTRHEILTAGQRLNAIDLDFDGDLDLVGYRLTDRDPDGVEEVIVAVNDGTPSDGGWTTVVLFDAELIPGIPIFDFVDVEPDGDLDFELDDIWYENDGTPLDGGWIPHVDDSFGLRGYNFCDVDGDGDLDGFDDRLGPSQGDAEVGWLENLGDDSWPFREILSLTDLSGNRGFTCQDFDNDADPDFAYSAADTSSPDVTTYLSINPGGSALGDWGLTIPGVGGDFYRYLEPTDLDGDSWIDILLGGTGELLWEVNEGGHFEIEPTIVVEGPTLEDGEVAVPLFALDASHLGRSGDDAIDIVRLIVDFPGRTESELDALIQAVEIRIDDGDQVFEAGQDVAIGTRSRPYSLEGESLSFELASSPEARVSVGADLRLWLTVDVRDGASTADPDDFTVFFESVDTEAVTASSDRTMRVNNLTDDATATLTVVDDDGSVVFVDGFESGGIAAWAALVN